MLIPKWVAERNSTDQFHSGTDMWWFYINTSNHTEQAMKKDETMLSIRLS